MKKTISLVLVLAFVIGLIPSMAKAKLVACVGDSITYGHGIPDRNDNSYPAQLAMILRGFDSEWETQNFGHSGATLLRSKNASYVTKAAYNRALTSEPDLVVIMLGSNDSARATSSEIEQNFISDYLALIDSFAQLPSQPRIFVCYPPPIFGGGYGSDTIIRDLIIPLIQQLPTYRDVEVIDTYTPLEESGHLFPDDLHPNAEGAKVMAEIVAPMILGFRGHPDLNGDGIVDSADMCLMVDYWHTNEPFYDIAPPPCGDGIVDVQDLIVLAEYLFTYPGTMALWKMDETDGSIAYDSVGLNDGTVIGVPAWRPEGGQVNGALELNGTTFIMGGSVLNPADGPFSVLAWVKGGQPGQGIITQQGGVDWLLLDPATGALMTELKGGGRLSKALSSDAIVVDGDWHRIGFTWDGSHRRLYVDDVLEAASAENGLAGSTGTVVIGCRKTMAPGTFFTGLIDDVRIYNRAVKP